MNHPVKVVPVASMLTPNHFEAEQLTSSRYLLILKNKLNYDYI